MTIPFHGFSGINNHIAALDVDGVMLNFDKSFAYVGSQVLGRPLLKLNNRYSLRERYGLSAEESSRIWAAMDSHENGWSGLFLIPGCVEAINTLRSMGLSVHLVTGIENKQMEQRLANLEKYNVKVDGIDCVGMGSASKLPFLEKLKPVLFVDDLLSHLVEASFIPYRVWVDNGDHQGGHVLTEEIIRTTSLKSWVDHFSGLSHSQPRFAQRPKLRLV